MPTEIERRVKSLPVVVTVASSKWSTSDGMMQAALKQYMSNSHVIILTEQTVNSRDRLFDQIAGKGDDWNHLYFGTRHDSGRDECCILWDRSILAKAGDGVALPMTQQTFKRESGVRAPRVHLLKQPLMVRGTGQVIDFQALHNSLDNTALRASIALEVLDNVAKHERTIDPDIAISLNGDFNKNIKIARERQQVNSRLTPNLTSVWRAPFPREGTHGSQIIDLAYRRGIKQKGRARLRKDLRESDHRAFSYTLVG